ncbi:MAG: hypothetical protein BWY66_00564 [bacterium ADurb.Bin374]|nr:MAG: hypothetical protein BWY66_00564 [bacterium ADurb.Bin374]
MLKSDYANELMLAKMQLHNYRVGRDRLLKRSVSLQRERDALLKLANNRRWLFPIGFGLGFALATLFIGLI